MANITPAAVFPVAAPFNTTPAYSGTFIPAIWSGKLNANFYAASTFADIANTDWEGEIKRQGDTVIINNEVNIGSHPYTAGQDLSYDVPEPSTQELHIDQGRYFAYTVEDVLKYQSNPKMLDQFAHAAGEGARVDIDSECWYATFNGAAAANKGATAGAKSGAYNLGTDTAPVALDKDTVLPLILAMASALDEQNVPDDGRYLVIDSVTRMLLMQSPLAAANFTGDATSPTRNGLIGGIDRFRVYVTNQLPRINTNTGPWVSGNGEQNSTTSSGSSKKSRALVAGHRTAITFASQFTETQTVRSEKKFADYIRSLNVYGRKVVKPESLVTAVVA